METQIIKSNDVSTLKSPPRILVRFFHRSRDNWKLKYMAGFIPALSPTSFLRLEDLTLPG